MIIIECSWCDTDIAVELDATSIDCPDCLVSVELASDPHEIAAAA
jgi:hypothetical protein